MFAVWGLYLTSVTWRQSSCCMQCALILDFIPPDFWLTGLKSCWVFFLEHHAREVNQTHIANIDTLKHWLIQVRAELDHRNIEVSYCTMGMSSQCMHESSRETLLTFAFNLDVALWSISWIVGLCNVKCTTLLLADFECLMLYYSRFCAFCV